MSNCVGCEYCVGCGADVQSAVAVCTQCGDINSEKYFLLNEDYLHVQGKCWCFECLQECIINKMLKNGTNQNDTRAEEAYILRNDFIDFLSQTYSDFNYYSYEDMVIDFLKEYEYIEEIDMEGE